MGSMPLFQLLSQGGAEGESSIREIQESLSAVAFCRPPVRRRPGEGRISSEAGWRRRTRFNSLLAAGRSAPLSHPLWGDQTVQVSNNQALARILERVHFSVDFIRIKAYYSIVKMGKATAASDGAGTKTGFPVFCFLDFCFLFSQFLLFPKMVQCLPSPGWPGRVIFLTPSFCLPQNSNRVQPSEFFDFSTATVAFFAHFQPVCDKSTEVPLHEHFTPKTALSRSRPVKASQGIFIALTMNCHPNQALWPVPASHSNGGGKVVRESILLNQPCRRARKAVTHERNLYILGRAALLRRPKVQSSAATLPCLEGEGSCPVPGKRQGQIPPLTPRLPSGSMSHHFE